MPTASKLADKQTYSELTDKQQAVIDARINNPDVSRAEIERIAGVGASYASTVLDKYPHIVERQKELQNDELARFEEETEAPGQVTNANGETKTVIERDGNRFEGEPLDLTWSYLSERDVDPALENVEADASTQTISVCFEFGRDDTEFVLDDENAPVELKKALVDTLLGEVFEE